MAPLLLFLLAFTLTSATARSLPAQEEGAAPPGVKARSSPSTPPEATDAPASAVADAIRKARKELRSLEASLAAEADALGEEITRETEAVFDLRRQEREIEAEINALVSEIRELDEKTLTVREEQRRAEEQMDAAARELRSQAVALRDRFRHSLLGAEHPEIVRNAEELAGGGGDGDAELDRDVNELLDVYGKVLDLAGAISTFQTPLRLSGTEGTIETVNVLRLGLLTGYYSHPESGESGLVLQAEDAGEGFRGQAEGLSTSQQASIAAFVDNPQGGGTPPLDVTGGAGIATLESEVGILRWFEMGGVFMWALLAVAITATVLILERSVVLAVLSMGIQRQIRRVLSLVQSGRYDEASTYCRKIGGATGNVLHAALVHRRQERSVIEDAVQEALLHQAPKFQARLSFIALCAAVAPLIGLLGTVTGMIMTFKMVTLFGTSDPRFMAGGISEALITTQGGLYCAIPCLLFRGVLGSVADGAVGKLETGAMSVVLALVKSREDEVPAGVGS